MWFERMSCVVSWRVESERDHFDVLRGRVEGVAEVHEVCITAPLETVLDVRVREPCTVEEIGCCYSD